jgi:hypothetical protein
MPSLPPIATPITGRERRCRHARTLSRCRTLKRIAYPRYLEAATSAGLST